MKLKLKTSHKGIKTTKQKSDWAGGTGPERILSTYDNVYRESFNKNQKPKKKKNK